MMHARSESPSADGSGAMFDRIAQRYDRMNRLMSLGMDRRWRRKLIQCLGDIDGLEVLDVATGTADVAIAIAQAHPRAKLVGLDPSPRMLEVGRQKVATAGLESRLSLIAGDAQSLPFSDGRFAATCIAFGIRNVPDRDLGLREMARVTRFGGRVVVLELGEPSHGPLAPFARFHIRHLVPRLGAWLSGEQEYRYLQSSVAAFPPAETFAQNMRDAGIAVDEVIPFAFGAANLYVGSHR